MVPIELVWLVVMFIFGMIGVVRGYLKELGVTTVVVLVLFGMITVESRVVPLAARFVKWLDPGQLAYWLTILYILVLIVVGFISYHGQTLAFEGKMPAGKMTVALSFGAGLVNGYLIAGSIWHYLHRISYPYLSVDPENLSAFAYQLIKLMAPGFLAPYLLYLAIFLVLMRVIR